MKKLNLKCNKGVSLISLVITVILLLLLTTMIMYNAPDFLQTKALKDLQNDILVVEEKIENYYAQSSKIPGRFEYSWSVNPGKTYYIIDLQMLGGLTLNYGKEGYNAYKDVRNAVMSETLTDEQKEALNNITDIFIVDGETLKVYYAQGITLDGETYYTYE